MITLDDLRRYAVARNFPRPTTLNRALQQMGFVQAERLEEQALRDGQTLESRFTGDHRFILGPRGLRRRSCPRPVT